MLKYNIPDIFRLLLIILIAMVSVFVVFGELGKRDPLIIPVALTQKTVIESVTIAIQLDADKLRSKEATLGGEILQASHYALSSPIKARSATERNIVAHPEESTSRGISKIASVSFDRVEAQADTALTSLTKFIRNASAVPGGFQINDAVCQNVRAIFGSCINDGRLGLPDAICMWQIESGMKPCYLGNPGLKEAVRTLQMITGTEQ